MEVPKRYTKEDLPQLEPGRVFASDAGALTIAVFVKKIELGKELTFLELIEDPAKFAHFEDHYKSFGRLVLEKGFGYFLESIGTWKASKHMATEVLGLTEDKWKELTIKWCDFVGRARSELEAEFRAKGRPCPPIVNGGVLGPREGGYKVDIKMSAEEAESFNEPQIKLFAQHPAIDYVIGDAIADANEAIGMIRASKKHGIPVAVAFVLSKANLRLQSGQTLKVVFVFEVFVIQSVTYLKTMFT